MVSNDERGEQLMKVNDPGYLSNPFSDLMQIV